MMVKGAQTFSLLGIILSAGLLLTACQPKEQIIAPDVPGIGLTITGKSCPGLVVQVGKQVTWLNEDRRDHIIRHVPDDGESVFSSGILKPQDRFSFTFLEPGTFPYSCTIEGVELGTVIVEP